MFTRLTSHFNIFIYNIIYLCVCVCVCVCVYTYIHTEISELVTLSSASCRHTLRHDYTEIPSGVVDRVRDPTDTYILEVYVDSGFGVLKPATAITSAVCTINHNLNKLHVIISKQMRSVCADARRKSSHSFCKQNPQFLFLGIAL